MGRPDEATFRSGERHRGEATSVYRFEEKDAKCIQTAHGPGSPISVIFFVIYLLEREKEMNHPIMHTMMESFLILNFEMLGTCLLTCLWISATAVMFTNVASIFLGFFVLLILSARISGAHYNPVVTLAFMLRKDAG